jgi:hypothetical protein
MMPGEAPGILRKGYWIMRGSEKLLRVPYGAVGDITKEHLALVGKLVTEVKGTLGWWCEYGQPGDPDILCTKIQVPRERAGALLQSVLDSRLFWEIDDAFPYGTPPFPDMVQFDLSLRGLER